ncbi:MAG TPA: hypothetical protein PKE05_04865 [Microthrixaceae bacterium]|nr:hypothetical protein [Microthrixaceae bacterium]
MTDNVERERKFLVADVGFLDGHTPERIAQAYIVSNESVELRVRLGSGSSLLTIKSGEAFVVRDEFEFELPSRDLATALFDTSALVILKDRYSVVSDGGVWDVDVFLGRNKGLVVAEIEFDEGQLITIPEWCGEEVTADPKYYNRSLAAQPFDLWNT